MHARFGAARSQKLMSSKLPLEPSSMEDLSMTKLPQAMPTRRTALKGGAAAVGAALLNEVGMADAQQLRAFTPFIEAGPAMSVVAGKLDFADAGVDFRS